MSDQVTTANPRTLNLFVGLLRGYMDLKPEQVVVYNQKWRIPSNDELYISVGFLSVRPYGTTMEYEEFEEKGVTGAKEVTSVSSQETVSVNVYSSSQAALERKDEVLLAFSSFKAAQLCDTYGIKLGKLPVGFADASEVEGTSRLNRFVLTINALVSRRQERIIEIFDTFEPTGLFINP